MSNFRTMDFWKSAIMTLPDAAFFELLRTVFGKVKTPFSKQALVGDLEKFLQRSDIQKNIAAYIGRDEARIIAAVAALNEPVPGELETFFAGEFSYAELHDLVVNMEERFILYRFLSVEQNQNKSFNRLALNPALQAVLSPFFSDRSLLFPSIVVGEIPQDEMVPVAAEQPYVFDNRMLAALLSFVSQNSLFYRGEGKNIRRRVANSAQSIFGSLPLETIIGGLRTLGLFTDKDELLFPDYSRFTAFDSLSCQERIEYCAAGILYYEETQTETAPWLLRSKIRDYATFIDRFYSSLDPNRLYSRATLQKLAYILDNNKSFSENDKIINIMEKVNLISRISCRNRKTDSYWRIVPYSEDSGSAHSKKNKDAVIVMDTSSTFLMYPEIAYNDAIGIAAFSIVIEAGNAAGMAAGSTVRFELNRDTCTEAFNRGLHAASIIEILNRLSCNRIDENVIFSLQDWEKRHGEVALRKGLVLTLAPEQRHLAQTRQLARLIVESPAPGVYLLPEDMEDRAIEALHKAGIAIIANRGAVRDAIDSEYSSSRNYFPSLQTVKAHTGDPCPDSRMGSLDAASGLIDSFHSVLSQMQLGSEEHDELESRINRRLILCESQLKNAAVRYEKLSARGLDYVGKAMIAKQAISQQSPVEIILPGKERIFGIPKALEKTGRDSILVVELLNGEKTASTETALHEAALHQTMRIPLGKMSMLRRIKKSIFENNTI